MHYIYMHSVRSSPMNITQQLFDKFKTSLHNSQHLNLTIDEVSVLSQILEKAELDRAVLNSIIESSDDAILSKDLNGNVTSWNAAAQRIFGYNAQEMVGKSILKLIPPHLHTEEDIILSQLRKGIRIEHFETIRMRKDGVLIDVSLTISPIYNSFGEITGISKIARDVTKYRKAEKDKMRLNAIVESSEDAIISKDFDSKITSWNQAAERIFGYSADEMIGQSILTVIPIERHNEEPIIISQLKKGIRVDHFETERLRKDGTLINVSLTISPIKDAVGNIIGVSKIARDVTYRKQLEKKKDEFVGFVSHELKTPLTSLKSYIQIARRRITETDFLEIALQRAEVQIRKMETMIKEFLNVASFEQDKMQLNRTTFDIGALVKECVGDAMIIGTKHHFVFQSNNVLMVDADRDKIAMVMTNLINNAEKYSPDDSTITITIENQIDSVIISIQDEGIGISKEDQKGLFEKFYRIENDFTKNISGFGIGLYLIAAILKEHDTTVSLKSELGKGSTFSFHLAKSY